MRDSVVFYRSFYEAIKNLPPDDFKKSACAILDYALDGETPEGSGIEWAVYVLTKPQIDANNKRYENGKKAIKDTSTIDQTDTKPTPNQYQTVTKSSPNGYQVDTEPHPNVNVNVNVNDIKENTLKGVKENCFIPPTPENVKEYCREKGYEVDAERFVDFYESKGWMIGKNKMKDWKAAVRNWTRGQKKPAGNTSEKKNGFKNTTERNYNFAELERAVVNR